MDGEEIHGCTEISTIATDDSKWDSCGWRIATVPPKLPRGLSLIRCHTGNTLFYLTVAGKTLKTSAVSSVSTSKDTDLSCHVQRCH